MKLRQRTIQIAIFTMIAGTILATYGCGNKSKDGDSPQQNDTNLSPETTEGLKLMKTYCEGCHSISNKKGNVALENLNDAKTNAGKSEEEVEQREMPIKVARSQPSDEERVKLVAFFRSLK